MGTKRRFHALRSILFSLAMVVGIGGAMVAVAPAASAVTASTVTASVVTAPTMTHRAASRSTTCPTVYWGSLAKVRSGSTVSQIVGVRSGQHPCFDRLVVDLNGRGSLGYDVRYVTQVHSEGVGDVVPVRGGAAIQIVARAPAYNPFTGKDTYRPADPRELANLTGFATLRQVAYAGSFEGQTTLALGVRARLPMRVFVLAGPGGGQRLVIDVAHQW